MKNLKSKIIKSILLLSTALILATGCKSEVEGEYDYLFRKPIVKLPQFPNTVDILKDKVWTQQGNSKYWTFSNGYIIEKYKTIENEYVNRSTYQYSIDSNNQIIYRNLESYSLNYYEGIDLLKEEFPDYNRFIFELKAMYNNYKIIERLSYSYDETTNKLIISEYYPDNTNIIYECYKKGYVIPRFSTGSLPETGINYIHYWDDVGGITISLIENSNDLDGYVTDITEKTITFGFLNIENFKYENFQTINYTYGFKNNSGKAEDYFIEIDYQGQKKKLYSENYYRLDNLELTLSE